MAANARLEALVTVGHEPRTRWVTWMVVGLVAVTTALRLALAWRFFGFHTGDDVEIVQAALMRALRWPYQPLGLRNLLASDILAAPMAWLASTLGVESVSSLVRLTSVPFVALASANVVLVHRLARSWLGDERPALLAAGLVALHWLPLGYGSMVEARVASTTCVLGAAALLLGGPGLRGRAWLAGGLMGVAWAFRYSEGIFLAPLLLLVPGGGAGESRGAQIRRIVASFAVTSLITIGVEDWLSHGTPFASLADLIHYTLIERRSTSLVKAQPWYWYAWRLPRWLPLPLLPLVWQARRVEGWPRIGAFVAIPIVALSAFDQKQLRYLQAVVPFALLLGAAGAWSLWRRGHRRVAAVLVVLSFLAGVRGISFLARKSMAAVAAARQMGSSLGPADTVCLSQSWAYGNDLFLAAGTTVRDLDYPLARATVERELGACAAAAVYLEDLERDAALEPGIAARGFVRARTVRWGRSKPVVVFSRRPETAVLEPAAAASVQRR